MTEGPLEVEVKFLAERAGAVRTALKTCGARREGEAAETNFVYDDAQGSLKERDMLLRLRSDRAAVLTLKRRPRAAHGGFKVMEELEVGVSDFATTDAILLGLGFHRSLVYEKLRERFILDDVEVCIDTLPFGTFVELEGQAEAIVRVSRSLGFAWSRRIVVTYHRIFQVLKSAYDLPFSDITFENFRGYAVDCAAHRQGFEAGNTP